MVIKKQYLKSTGRLFTKHIIRLLSIAAIFIVSVGLMTGLGNVKRNVGLYLDDVYHVGNVHDIEVVGVYNGKQAANKLKDKYDIDKIEVNKYVSDEAENEKYAKRYYFYNFKDNGKNVTIDKFVLSEGRYPIAGKNEMVIHNPTPEINVGLKINDTVKVNNQDFTIVGIVKSSTTFANTKEPSNSLRDIFDKTSYRYLDHVFYFDNDDANLVSSEVSDRLSITIKDRNFNSFSDSYKTKIKNLKTTIYGALYSSGHIILENQILTLNEQFCFSAVSSYANKVGIIAIIFIVFFALITILVTYSTMSRLLDEERGSMAVLKTLGYSNFKIALRYILFMLVAGIIGSAVALAPAYLVNKMIIDGFRIQFALSYLKVPAISLAFFVCSSVTLLASLGFITFTCFKKSSQKPVELLTPKAPKVGKKILLERIKPIWSRLSFKYKSTCRNIFLFKARFWMTLLSIITSTALIFASFSLLDNSFKVTMPGIEPLRVISGVLLLFSGLLCMIVIYNITNINVSERTREIATLMVLGYRKDEVSGYIYREIYIMAIIGALLGLPAGVGFTQFVFKYMNFGSLSNTNWWAYIVTPILTVFFAILATLFLNRKIIKTDMNESLKVLE